MENRYAKIALVLALFSSQMLMSDASARGWGTTSSQSANLQPPSGASAVRPIAKGDKDPYKEISPLKDKVRIEDLPDYPGRAKFLGGRTYPSLTGGQSYDMDLSVTELPAQVMSWYKQALIKYQWKTLSQGDKFICAVSKRGDHCSISTAPDTKLNGGRALVHVMYQHAKIAL